MDDAELEKSTSWDLEHAERRGPVSSPRAVVSVAFSREDFERVSEYAERLGLRTSEFIRTAALDRVRGGVTNAYFVLVTGDRRNEIYLDTPPPQTRVYPESPKGWIPESEKAATG